jgi:hypothetical protein
MRLAESLAMLKDFRAECGMAITPSDNLSSANHAWSFAARRSTHLSRHPSSFHSINEPHHESPIEFGICRRIGLEKKTANVLSIAISARDRCRSRNFLAMPIELHHPTSEVQNLLGEDRTQQRQKIVHNRGK